MGAPTPPDALLQGTLIPNQTAGSCTFPPFFVFIAENGRSRNALVGCWRSLGTHSMLPPKLGGIWRICASRKGDPDASMRDPKERETWRRARRNGS